MNRILTLCGIMLIAATAFAQQPRPVKPVITDESEAILKKMQQQWLNLQSSKISFTLQSAKEGKNSAAIKGTLWTQGKSYRLVLPEQVIICDGNNIWNYLPNSKEVSISPYEEDGPETSINPLQAIAGYTKYYRSAFIRETTEKGMIVQIIDLYPKQGQSFYKIRLVIRKDKQLPLRAVIHEKNGATDTYSFDQILMNPKTDPGLFTFKTADFPGVEVIDMR